MVKDGLIKKILFRGTAVALGLNFLYGCTKDLPTEPPPPNYEPQITLEVSPTSGMVPLDSRIRYTCTDRNGPEDIVESRLNVGSYSSGTTSLDSTFTFTEPGTDTTEAYCRDRSGEEASAGPIEIQATQPPEPQKSISQTAEVIDSINVQYTVSFENITQAELEVRNEPKDSLLYTRTITSSPYEETFLGLPKGDNYFIFSVQGLTPDTATAPIEDFPSVAPDFSGLNLNINEGDSLDVNLERSIDKNPEDNPVRYTGVTSSGVGASIGAFPNDTVLTIKAPEILGPNPVPYSMELAREGSLEKKILSGEVFNLPRISGQLQDARLDAGQRGKIIVYSARDSTFLKEILTDIQGNFDFRLDQPPNGLILQMRLEKPISDSNYVRTIRLPGKDTTGLLVRPYHYSSVLFENGISREDFISYFNETNYFFVKPSQTLINIEILDENPFGHGVFTPDEQDFIKDVIQNYLSCYIEGRQFNIQKDNQSSQKHYTISPSSTRFVLPDEDWVIIQKDTTLSHGGGARYFDNNQDGYLEGGGIVLKYAFFPRLVSHELGHIYVAPNGHVIILANFAVMDGSGGPLIYPGPADCEVARVMNETTYQPREKIQDILGLEFLPKK
jgi:hypothetical protein